MVLGGSITSAAAEGVVLPSSQLLAVLGRLETTAAAAPLQLVASSDAGMLVLGTLASAGPLSLDRAGRLFTDVPSMIRTTGSGLLSIHSTTGPANLNGTIEAGAGGLDLQVNGTFSLAGPIRSNGPVAIQALGINLASSGGIVSQGNLSLAATGLGSGSGLQLAGLLVAGGSVAAGTQASATRRQAVRRVATAEQTLLESTESSVQRQDIQMDPASSAELRLSSASSAVIGGSQEGSDVIVAPGAWLAAPNLSIRSKEQPTLLHDLIARDRLAIHSDTSLLLRPLAVLELGSAAAAATTAPTPAAELTLTAPQITLPRDPVDLVIEAQTTAPQAFLTGTLSQPLTLALSVTTPQGQRVDFSATVAAGQRSSLQALLESINSALAEAATAAGLPATSIPSLGLRGANLRLQLGRHFDIPQLDQLALVLDGAASSGLEQLGFLPLPAPRQGVIAATVLSQALATRVVIGSNDLPYSSLVADAGVSAVAASDQASLSWELHPAPQSTTTSTALVDVPVLQIAIDQAAGGGTVPRFDTDLQLTGRTRELEVVSDASMTLTALVNTSSAPRIQLVSYRTSSGSLTLDVGADPRRRLLSSTVPIQLQAAGDLTIQRNPGLAASDAAVLQLPGLKGSAGGRLLFGDGVQLQLHPNGRPSPLQGLTLSGASVTLNGGITSASPISTGITATSGDLMLQAGTLSTSLGFDLTGLQGDQDYVASGRLLQAFALGSPGGTAPRLSLQAGTGLTLAAAINAASSLNLTTRSGELRSDPQLYRTSDGVLVDLLGYRVDGAGVFVDAAGQSLPADQAPLYAGAPASPVSGGAIQAPELSLDAGSGSLLLQNSLTPAGTSTATLVASAFRSGENGFALADSALGEGEAVRFYGVQSGAVGNLADGGLYVVVRPAGKPGLLQLAASASDAAAGRVIALNLAPNLTGSAAVGQLVLATSLERSRASLRGASLSLAQSATVQAANLSLTSNGGDINLLGEAWLRGDHTTLVYPATADLRIARSRTDLRRAILQTNSLAVPSAGGLVLDGYLDIGGTEPSSLRFSRDLAVQGELTASEDLTLTTPGTVTISSAGSISSDGDLAIDAMAVQVNSDATRPGWEQGTVVTGVTPITSTSTVAAGTAMQDLSLSFDTGVVAHLQVNPITSTLQLVGQDGTPLPHGLVDGTGLYYQSAAQSNGVAGGAGLINTSPDTRNPDAATRYTALVLDATTFQLQRLGQVVTLTAAPFATGDALNGLEVNTRNVTSTTTETRQIGTTEVVAGYSWYTYNLDLLQDAFYNPQTQKIVESFIPGIDFQLNSINWGTDVRPSSDLPWNAYSAGQRNVVLSSLGYRPFYAVDVNSVQLVTNRNGVLSTKAVANPWFQDPQVLALPSSGALAGKAIVGPAGAITDPYSLVNRSVGPTLGLSLNPQKTSALATAGPSARVSQSDGLSLEAWVYLDSDDAGNGLVLTVQNPRPNPSFGNSFISLQQKDGKLALSADSLVNGTRTLVRGSQTLPKQQWLHLVATLRRVTANQAEVALYINGVSDPVASPASLVDFASNTQLNGLRVAEPYASAGYAGISGAIRQVKVWGEGRSAAQVVEDMTQAPYGKADALAYWFPFAGTGASGIPDQAAASLVSGASFVSKVGIDGPDANGFWEESVGDSVFNADVKYTQTGSALTATRLSQTVQNPYDPSKTISLTTDVADADDGSSLWQVSYAGNGSENVTLQRNRVVADTTIFSTGQPFSSSGSVARKPLWVDNSSQAISSFDPANPEVYGVGRGLPPFLQGNAATPVLAPPNQAYTLGLSLDGGLQLRGPDGKVLWEATDAKGQRITGAVEAVMQPDGNFVLYKAMQALDKNGDAAQALWSTKTSGTNSASLQLADDGSLRILNSSGAVSKTLYAAPVGAIRLGNGSTLKANQGINSVLWNKGTPAGWPEGTLSTSPDLLSPIKTNAWHQATLNYGTSFNHPDISINAADPPVTTIGAYGPSLVCTWVPSATNGLATHLDPGLTGTSLSFSFNRLDEWNADSKLALYYKPDGASTAQLIFDKALPTTSAFSPADSTQTSFTISGAPSFLTFEPRPFIGNLYGSDAYNEQTFDIQLTLAAGTPSGSLVVGTYPEISSKLSPQFAINNIDFQPAIQLPSIQAASNSNDRLDYVASTASLSNPTLLNGSTLIKDVGILSKTDPLAAAWSASQWWAAGWTADQNGAAPSAPSFASVGGVLYAAVRGADRAGYLYWNSSTDGGLTWSGWQQLPAGMNSDKPVALGSYGGSLYLSYVGRDNESKINITQLVDAKANSWRSQYQIPGQMAQFVTLNAENNELAIYYVGPNSVINRSASRDPANMNSWSSAGAIKIAGLNQTASSNLSVVSIGSKTYVAYQGGTNSMPANTVYLTSSSGGQASPYSNWSTIPTVPQPPVAYHAGVALTALGSQLVIGYPTSTKAGGEPIFQLKQSGDAGQTWSDYATYNAPAGTNLPASGENSLLSLQPAANQRELLLAAINNGNNNAINLTGLSATNNPGLLNVSGGNGVGYGLFSQFSQSALRSTTWPVWGPGRSLQEIWTSYGYNWQSVPFEWVDRRQNLSFAATSRPQSIFELQPVFQQFEVTTTSSVSQLQANPTLRPVYVTETRTSGLEVQTQTVDRRGEAVRFDSLRGRAVTLTTSGSSRFQGNLSAAADASLSIAAGGSLDLSANATAPGGGPSVPGSTVAAGRISLRGGQGLQLGAGLLLAGQGDQPSQAISLDAGSGSLHSAALLASTGQLSLSGADLSLPLQGTRPLQARNISLDFGAKLMLEASQLPAEGQDHPEPLLLELGNVPEGVADGSRLSSPDPSASLQLKRLKTTLPFVVDVGDTLALAGPISGQRLDLNAGELQASPFATTLTASESLTLRQRSSDPLTWSTLAPTAPSLSLSSGGDVQISVSATDLELSSAGQVLLENLSSGPSRLVSRGAGLQELAFQGPLTVVDLNSGAGDVTLSLASGDLQLGAVHQSTTGVLRMHTPTGRIVSLAEVTADQREIGTLWAEAGQGMDLSLQRLLRLHATSKSGDLNLQVAGGDRELLLVDTLQTDSQTGEVNLDAGRASLQITTADQIAGKSVDLRTAQGLEIRTPQATTLQAGSRITLVSNNLQADPSRLTLATGELGTIELQFNQLALADALPQLPLLQAYSVVLTGRGGLRLTDQSFNVRQIDYPIHSVLFRSVTLPDQTNLLQQAPDPLLVPARWPYELQSKTLLVEDGAGIPYVLRRDPGLPADRDPQPYTHYQPDGVMAPGFPYLYQAVLSNPDGLAPDPVVRFRSSEKLLTASNLAQASLSGITASAIDPLSIQPVLVDRPATDLRPVSAHGEPVATAILANTTRSKVAAVRDRLLDSLPPTPQLSSLIVRQPALYTRQEGALAGDRVWLDRNGNLQADADEPSAVVAENGQVRLGLGADLAPGDLLVVAPDPEGSAGSGPGAVLLASPSDPQISVLGTLGVLLARQGLDAAAVAASLRGFEPEPAASAAIAAPLAATEATLALQLATGLAEGLKLPLAQAYAGLAASLAAHPAPAAGQLDWRAVTADLVNRLPRAAAAVDFMVRLEGLPALIDALVQQVRSIWVDLEALKGRSIPVTDLEQAAASLARGLQGQLAPRIASYLQGDADATMVVAALRNALAMGLPWQESQADPSLAVVAWGDAALAGDIAQFQVRLNAPAPAGGVTLGYRTSGVVSRQGSVVIEAGRSSALITLSLADLTLATPGQLVLVLQDAPVGYRISSDLGAARASVLPLGSSGSASRVAAAADCGPVVQGTERNDLLLDNGPGTVVLSGGGTDRILVRPHPEAPSMVLDFDGRDGDRLQLLRADNPGLSLDDLVVLNGRLQHGERVLALLRGPAGTISFLRDVSTIVELVDVPTPASTAPARPEPNTFNQSLPTLSAATVQLAGPDSRVSVTAVPAERLQPDDALLWTGSGVSLSGPTSGQRLVQLRVEQAELQDEQFRTLLLYRTNAQGQPLGPDGLTPVTNPEQAVIAQIGAISDDRGRPLFTGSTSAVLLSSGQQLRALLQDRNGTVTTAPLEVETASSGLTLRIGANRLVLNAALSDANAVDQQLELARRAGLGDLLYLQDQDQVDVQLFSSCANTNSLAFLRVDIATDEVSGEPLILVAGVPVSNSEAFRQRVRQHLDPAFLVSQGGAANLTTSHVWRVSSGTGFYTPVMLTPSGEVFVLGSALNRDGRVHLRGLGDGAFAFEDLAADQGSDFDYNDGVLIVRRRAAAAVAEASVVAASGAGALELTGAQALRSASEGQLIRTSGVAANVLTLTGGGGVVLRQGSQADAISLAGGGNLLVMGRQGAGGRISLADGPDQLVIGLGTRDASASATPDRLSGFDPVEDRILLVGDGELVMQPTAEGLVLLLEDQPVLLLEGVVNAGAIGRQQPGRGELIARIQARGVLSVGLPGNRPGVSERSAAGLWRGTAVDLARAIAEQLLGSADRVLFAEPATDAELRESLRAGHLDLALLSGDPQDSDLAGVGDRSWTLPGATPDGDVTFLLPSNQTVFRLSVNRILQTPLQAELLGLSAAGLPAAAEAPLTPAQQRFLDLVDTGVPSSVGEGTPLKRGFVSGVLKRLGNAAELWTRFFSSAPRPAQSATQPLDIPVAGAPLAVATPPTSDSGDALATILARGVLRIAVASTGPGAEASLQAWQQQWLEGLRGWLGNAAPLAVLQLVPYTTAAQGLELLGSNQVDLLLPQASDHRWLDGVVGVELLALPQRQEVRLLVTRSSGIGSLSDLGGSRLGLASGANVEAALRQRLSGSGVGAGVISYPSQQQAAEALRMGQLDGIAIDSEDAQALQLQLANRGIDTELLPESLLAGSRQILLPINQSALRDALQSVAKALDTAVSIP